jgi:hypothetical protein
MSIRNETMPDFLCIGAQRSGTSWLTVNLRAAPDIWLPPSKEIHYFTRATKYPSPSHLACTGFLQKFFANSQEAKTWRWLFFTYARKWLAKAELHEKPLRLRWILDYFFGRPCDEWYLGLFREGAGKISGEITPDYSLLDPEDALRVTRLLPDVKVLLLMRDPLERVMSQMRYHMDGKASPDLSEARDNELVDFATAPGQVLRGNYERILNIWGQLIPQKNMHLVFYEDICERPAEVLADVRNFLGVKSGTPPQSSGIYEPRNASAPRMISGDLARHIAPAHEEVIRGCARTLGGPSLLWLQRFENLMQYTR